MLWMADAPHSLELAKIDLEKRRLDLERLQSWLKVLAVLGACITFAWSVWCYFDRRKSENDVRKIEASQPFLKLQLALFEEATRTAEFIATADDPSNEKDKIKRFWQLYWGELALVEHGDVETAMVQYGDLLNSKTYGSELQKAALKMEVLQVCSRGEILGR